MDATKVVEVLNNSGIIENIAANDEWKSKVFNVDGFFSGIVSVLFGRTTASAASAAATIYIEFSLESSGNNDWREYARFATQFAACESEAVNNTASAGATEIPMASTTNFTAGEMFYIKNTTLSQSEWRRAIAILTSPARVEIHDPIQYAQTSSTCYDLPDEFNCVIDQNSMTAIKRIRVRCENFSQSADIFAKGIFNSAVE